jgi:hypothetical protein
MDVLRNINDGSDSDIKLWPCLHTLVLPFARNEELKSVREFIVWRHRKGHPIQKLVLPLPVTPAQLTWMNDLREYVQVDIYTDDSARHFPTWTYNN